ncbi:hypothetical protein [Amycolatopsis panacis]|uniref:Uncharacterized protein n=1 Tax=Amycolatopsis panacis TaxID=2340917 RepID=A0A419I231_9PSEU|nr:hypothetical protein [Amycolatopsis panacis]RJQ83853.1 hypothetical protein D5S19_18785 [Amycolatopsis panacis]
MPGINRPSPQQISKVLDEAAPVRREGQNAEEFFGTVNGEKIRVIVDYDTPWRSTSFAMRSPGSSVVKDQNRSSAFHGPWSQNVALTSLPRRRTREVVSLRNPQARLTAYRDRGVCAAVRREPGLA